MQLIANLAALSNLLTAYIHKNQNHIDSKGIPHALRNLVKNGVGIDECSRVEYGYCLSGDILTEETYLSTNDYAEANMFAIWFNVDKRTVQVEMLVIAPEPILPGDTPQRFYGGEIYQDGAAADAAAVAAAMLFDNFVYMMLNTQGQDLLKRTGGGETTYTLAQALLGDQLTQTTVIMIFDTLIKEVFEK